MGKGERVLLKQFLMWSCTQERPPAMAFTHVDVGGVGQADLVCVSGPLIIEWDGKVYHHPESQVADRIKPAALAALSADIPITPGDATFRNLVSFGIIKDIWVVEIKDRLSYEAIGQVLGYSAVLHRQYRDTPLRVARRIIACTSAGMRLRIMCDALGIEVIDFPSPEHPNGVLATRA